MNLTHNGVAQVDEVNAILERFRSDFVAQLDGLYGQVGDEWITDFCAIIVGEVYDYLDLNEIKVTREDETNRVQIWLAPNEDEEEPTDGWLGIYEPEGVKAD